MPVNATPEYKAAEAEYRRARDPSERLRWLNEMHRLIPKHKGTEHVRADIKSKIKEITEELSGPKKGGARGGPVLSFRPEGAGQIVLIGPPNTGKSSLHVLLTGSQSDVGPYPFTTLYPQPGMAPFLDVSFQLIDLPPIASDHPLPWIGNTLQPADGALLVVDPTHAGCVAETADLIDVLTDRRVVLHPAWPADGAGDDDDPFTKRLPTAIVATHAEALNSPLSDVEVIQELLGTSFPAMAVSTLDAAGLVELGEFLFRALGVVRIYTKVPGGPIDRGTPYALRHGATVADLATLIHKDVGRSVKHARVWGSDGFDGRQVGRDHLVADGDVIELHT